jgi:hypothetical protein
MWFKVADNKKQTLPQRSAFGYLAEISDSPTIIK